MHIKDPAIPFDSVIVVIGANGFIALETCEKLLQAGFKVRGTVRDVDEHSKWMHSLFDGKWPGKFDLIEVSNFDETGVFDDAFRGELGFFLLFFQQTTVQSKTKLLITGAAGVIYVSTPMIFDSNPAKVVDQNINITINTLEAAAKAGVRRYVLNSSSKAVQSALYDDQPHSLTTSMYNWQSIQKTCCEPQKDTFEWMLNVYSAGRTIAELSFWSWIEEHKPPFVANCVVPDGNFGRGLHGVTSSNELLKDALAGNWDAVPIPLCEFLPKYTDSWSIKDANATPASLCD